MSRVEFILISAIVASLADAPQLVPQDTESASPRVHRGIAAIVDGEPIRDTELDARIGDKLLKIKTEEYGLRRSFLEEHIANLLLAREARKRNMRTEDLVRMEITERTQPVSEPEARAVVETAPQQYSALTPEQAIALATQNIRQRRTAMRRSEFVDSLRAKYPCTIIMEPPRLARRFAPSETRGAPGAPVSIVEFSDFQCEFCAQMSATLKRLQTEHPDQIQVAFKHFPLPMHPQAAKAAEASLCAAEQNKFWEMHDVFFNERQLLGIGQFQELGRRAGLEETAFEACLNSHRNTRKWQEDRAEGTAASVSSTPTVFINGRMIIGVRPYEWLREVVEEEIKRASRDNAMPAGASVHP